MKRCMAIVSIVVLGLVATSCQSGDLWFPTTTRSEWPGGVRAEKVDSESSAAMASSYVGCLRYPNGPERTNCVIERMINHFIFASYDGREQMHRSAVYHSYEALVSALHIITLGGNYCVVLLDFYGGAYSSIPERC
jgi:hypothetical protein